MDENEEIDRAVGCVQEYSVLVIDMGREMSKNLAESLDSEPDDDTREWWEDIMEYMVTIQENSELLGTANETVEPPQILSRMKAEVTSVLDLIVDELDMMRMGYLCSDVIRDDIFKTVVALERGLVKLGGLRNV